MPIGPGGERLPYPGDPGYMGNGPGMPNGGPPMGGPMEGPQMGGQAERLNQLLEARQMIDQEIAAIVGGPPGTENLDMLPPPPNIYFVLKIHPPASSSHQRSLLITILSGLIALEPV